MLHQLALLASIAAASPGRDTGTTPLPQDPPAALRLHGALSIVDDAGRRPAASGSITLWLNYQSVTTAFQAPVSQGRFELSVPAGADFMEVGRVRIDGMDAHVESSPNEPPADGAFDVEARWTPVSTLRVVAKDSGRELQQVELIECGSRYYPTDVARKFGKGLATPIRIDPWNDDDGFHSWRRTRSYWARAPGYAWAPLEFDHSAGGERRLELESDAAIVLELAGADPARPLFIRLLDADHPTLPVGGPQFPARTDEPTVIESLAPRHYTVELVEPVESQYEPRVLASRDVPLRSAQAAQVRFDMSEIATLAEQAQPRGVAFEGLIAIPAAWGEVRAELKLMRFDPLTGVYGSERRLDARDLRPIGNDAGLLQWKLDDALPGRWLAFVQPFQLSRVFELGANPSGPVRIDVPPPADVRVRLVDRTTGAELAPRSVGWYAMPPPEPSGVVPLNVRFDSKEKAFVFRAPVEDIVISVWMPDYEPVFVPESMRAGANEFTIELVHTTRIWIVLRDGNAVVPADDRARIQAKAVDGPESQRGTETSNGRLYLVVPGAGRYVVEVSGMTGYENATSAPVRVEAGETVELSIALLRKR